MYFYFFFFFFFRNFVFDLDFKFHSKRVKNDFPGFSEASDVLIAATETKQNECTKDSKVKIEKKQKMGKNYKPEYAKL